MKASTALLSGATAAAALTAMHECTRVTMPDPPRADVLGMEGIEKVSHAAGHEPPRHLRKWAMAADMVSNTLYYSLVGLGSRENAILCGAATGAAAGVGILALPGPLGLGSGAVNRTRHTQIMASGMYFAAGIIAGVMAKLLSKRE
jgi:hypothetical protein